MLRFRLDAVFADSLESTGEDWKLITLETRLRKGRCHKKQQGL